MAKSSVLLSPTLSPSTPDSTSPDATSNSIPNSFQGSSFGLGSGDGAGSVLGSAGAGAAAGSVAGPYGALAGAVLGLANGLINWFQNKKNRESTENLNKLLIDFQEKWRSEDRERALEDWDRNVAYQDPSNQRKIWEAAGFNPALLGGATPLIAPDTASATSGDLSGLNAPNYSFDSGIMQVAPMIADMQLKQAQAQDIQVQRQVRERQRELFDATFEAQAQQAFVQLAMGRTQIKALETSMDKTEFDKLMAEKGYLLDASWIADQSARGWESLGQSEVRIEQDWARILQAETRLSIDQFNADTQRFAQLSRAKVEGSMADLMRLKGYAQKISNGYMHALKKLELRHNEIQVDTLETSFRMLEKAENWQTAEYWIDNITKILNSVSGVAQTVATKGADKAVTKEPIGF